MKTADITDAVRSGKAVIAVYGLGWMGLSTACLFAEAGANVIGVDADSRVIELIKSCRSPISEPNLETLIKKHIGTGRFTVTGNGKEAAAKAAVIIIVVPTLLDKRNRPDYSAVEKACNEIGRGLKPGCLIIFESTVGPGTTETLVKEAIEKNSGFKAGSNFGLAYSPIRATPGQALQDIVNYPRVIAASDSRSLEAACAVLGVIIRSEFIKVRDFKTAETTKLCENTYRDINIALSNELAIFCERLGVDFDEIRIAANSQPHCHLHIPGAWVGGGCIPQNPFFLIDAAEELETPLRIAPLARKINDQMPSHTIRLVTDALRSCRKNIKRAKVAILGVSYRANVKEIRSSPVKEVIEILQKRGAKVTVFDPYFTPEELKKLGYVSARTAERTVDGVDCILVTVGHDEFKRLKLDSLIRFVRRPAALIDAGHVFSPTAAENAGFIYRGIGRGIWTK